MVFTGLVVVLAGWLGLVGLLFVFQRKLIYLPSRGPAPPAASVIEGAEDVSFETADGLRLAGWFVPARGGGDGTAVVFFNGNAGDRSLRAPFASAVSRAGFSVLLFDYRGYADNPGSPSEAALLADARAARAYLARRPGVAADRIVYYGESLGTGVAVALAAESPPAGLVLRSPFTSLAEVGQRHFFFLPVRWLIRDRFPVAERVARLDVPVLVIAGDSDEIVPAELSRRVYDAAPGSKRLVMIPGARHNDEALLDGERLIEEVVTFLEGL